jgi:hypothetical protein
VHLTIRARSLLYLVVVIRLVRRATGTPAMSSAKAARSRLLHLEQMRELVKLAGRERSRDCRSGVRRRAGTGSKCRKTEAQKRWSKA